MTIENGVMLISNSEVQAFKRCRRKWMIQWRRGLSPINEETIGARSTGTRVHKALQHLYVPEGENPIDPRITLKEAQAIDYQRLLNQYGGEELLPDFVTKDWTSAVSLEKAMIEGYTEWLAESGEDAGFRVVASETSIEVDFDVPGVDIPVRLIGKVDVRVQRIADGALQFLDHKTVADLNRPEKWISQDEQMLHYILLHMLAFPDDGRVTGALYNMLKKVKRTASARPPFYQRVPIHHNQHEIDSYTRRLRAVIRDIWYVHQVLDAGIDHLDVCYPVPGDTCSWQCDAATICPLFDDGSRADDALAGLFRHKDQLDRYRTKETI